MVTKLAEERRSWRAEGDGKSSVQLQVLLRALVNLDPYTFADEVAGHFATEENTDQTAEDMLIETIDSLTDEKLTGFALRLSLTGHIPQPHESESDFLAEADAAFTVPKPKAQKKPTKASTPIKSATTKATTKKKVAA